MPSYTTLQAARIQQTLRGADRNNEDAVIAALIPLASQMVDDWCGQTFNETLATFGFNGNVGATPTLLLKGRPLISVTTLTNGDGTAIDASKYELLPLSETPKTEVRLKPGTVWAAPYNSTTQGCYLPLPNAAYAEDAIRIEGKWGFNRRGTAAWRRTGRTLNASYTAGGLQLTLDAAPGKTLDVGSVLRIDSEYFVVTGDAANSLTTGFNSVNVQVDGAYAGSTAADHASGTAVFVYQVEPVVASATATLVAWLYQAQLDPSGIRAEVSDIGGATLSVDLPPSVKRRLTYPYWTPERGRRDSV